MKVIIKSINNEDRSIEIEPNSNISHLKSLIKVIFNTKFHLLGLNHFISS